MAVLDADQSAGTAHGWSRATAILKNACPTWFHQRTLHQIIECPVQFIGMRLQVLHDLAHDLPGGHGRNAGLGSA
jgi:hypothetical protein